MQFFAKKSKGFTLIELLVVIAIIGILSTIVLINVNAARNKAKDAAIKGALTQARVVAEIYYDDEGQSYAAFCDSPEEDQITTAVTTQGGTYSCNAIATAWCSQSTLVSSGASDYCADSSGYAGDTQAACDAVKATCVSD